MDIDTKHIDFHSKCQVVMLTSTQLRAARSLLGWSQEKLSDAADVGIATVKRMESGDGVVRGTVASVLKIQRALEDAGVLFIDEDDSAGPGVRLRKR